jgi:hypothetical protein
MWPSLVGDIFHVIHKNIHEKRLFVTTTLILWKFVEFVLAFSIVFIFLGLTLHFFEPTNLVVIYLY